MAPRSRKVLQTRVNDTVTLFDNANTPKIPNWHLLSPRLVTMRCNKTDEKTLKCNEAQGKSLVYSFCYVGNSGVKSVGNGIPIQSPVDTTGITENQTSPLEACKAQWWYSGPLHMVQEKWYRNRGRAWVPGAKSEKSCWRRTGTDEKHCITSLS